MTALDDLTRLCPPPADTPPTTDWPATEAALGVHLPADYKWLCDTYGPGSFGDFIDVRHPLGSTEWLSLTGPMADTVGRRLLEARENGRPVPHDPHSLFALGVTNTHHLLWVTEPRDEPDRWRVAVSERDGPGWFTFEEGSGLVASLTAVLSGRIRVPLFPEGLPTGPSFAPSTAPRPGGQQDTNAIHAWARAHGYVVHNRGRVPASVREAYEPARSKD
ncbi:hypothetical protein GTY65_15690 [Streptomyces sp. SID8379]|nr:hypothetical protein [Streptomyces sp. SID8379]